MLQFVCIFWITFYKKNTGLEPFKGVFLHTWLPVLYKLDKQGQKHLFHLKHLSIHYFFFSLVLPNL